MIPNSVLFQYALPSLYMFKVLLLAVSRAITLCPYNNFEISLVVFMPNITTNHAITYTNSTLKLITLRINQFLFVHQRLYLCLEQETIGNWQSQKNGVNESLVSSQAFDPKGHISSSAAIRIKRLYIYVIYMSFIRPKNLLV